MKKIKIGKLAGFCGGVNLCVTTLEKKLKEYKKLYCIGDVVHNKDVVNKFKELGLIVVKDISDIPDGETSVIRAHGAEKQLYEEAKKRNIKLIDLTCPKVLKIRKIIEKDIDKEDTYILLFGEKDHPETKSTFSFCGSNASIIYDSNDIDKIIGKCSKYKNIIVISQTTFNESKFLEYCDVLKNRLNNNVIIKNTICNATHSRQIEVKEMAKNNDCMIVIGGLKSSNSNKLNDISKKYCHNTFFIENIKDLDIKKVLEFDNIGIMAGASTPNYIIEEVYDALC